MEKYLRNFTGLIYMYIMYWFAQ